jgi:hypothetical protein
MDSSLSPSVFSPAAMHRVLCGVLCACIVPLSPIVVMANPPDSVDFRLDNHRWAHRLLFVFASSDTSEGLARQNEAFAGRDAGVRERDLLLLTVTGSDRGTYRMVPSADPQPLTTAAARRLRDRFDVALDAFRVVLVGKDGTEKRRDAAPVPARSVFDTIDAMPMRQREMREEGGGE